MGFFIDDLHRQIEQLHREEVSLYGRETFKLYRDQGLSTADLDKLKSSVGGLWSFNSFVATRKDRHIAQFLAESSSHCIDNVGVGFVMTIDPALTSTPFANIAHGQRQLHLPQSTSVVQIVHSVDPKHAIH